MFSLGKNEILLLRSKIVKPERICPISKISEKKYRILHEAVFWNSKEHAGQH